MKSLWIALGIMGMIPLLAVAQSPTAGHSVIKQVGFGHRVSGNCTTCGTGGPGCSTVVPAPTCGPANCCPRPCLLEAFKRGLRSLDCLIPCGLRCKSNCGPSCSSPCDSCSVGCGAASSCTSCCTKSRAHFFAFRKSKCCSPCGDMGCSSGMPVEMMSPPTPMADDPFIDDNMPPPGRDAYYKPYWKKGPTQGSNHSGHMHSGTVPASHRVPTPASLDPYATTTPVHIKAKPVRVAQAQPAQPQPRLAQPMAAAKPVAAARPMVAAKPVVAAQAEPAYPTVHVAATQEVATVSMTISDDDAPPAPPQLLPVTAAPQRIDRSIPANPLRR